MSTFRYPTVPPAGGIEFLSPIRASNVSENEVVYTDSEGNIVGSVRKNHGDQYWTVDIANGGIIEKSPTKYAAFLRLLSSIK